MKTNIINWIKLSLAIVLAIEIAMFFKLDFAISAGIIAILSIQPTKKETINTAISRFIAFFIAISAAFVCFKLLGVTVYGFIVYMIIYIITCVYFKWNNALVMNSVLVSHFVTVGRMDMATVTNEIMIFVIGVTIGIILNLHLRKKTQDIEEIKKETDEQIVYILGLIAERIVNKKMPDYNDKIFSKLESLLRKAKNLAEENFNNQLRNADVFDMEYIEMREHQYLVLYEMYKDISSINSKPHTAEIIAEFFIEMAGVFHRNNDGKALMEKFIEMDLYMKSQVLPVTRQEFEDRAKLFILMRRIEEFILIKMEFYNRFH